MGVQLLTIWAVGMAVVAAEPSSVVLQQFAASRPLMGAQFEIVLYAYDEAVANHAFDSAFDRVEQLDTRLSDYDPQSELSRLSRSAPHDEWMPVSRDLWNVLAAAEPLSRRSDGAFDVTVGPLTRLWRRARRRKKMPDEERLADALQRVGHMHLKLDPVARSARLMRPGMRIDLGGIAKGYAADEALAALRRLGISRSSVDAGGDLALGDPPPGQVGWKIGLGPGPGADPRRFLRLSNCGVATSGDAFQYVEIDGRRYSHILDPRTGLGITRQGSVTVIAPSCMTADALASAACVVGPDDGIRLVEATCGASTLVTVIEGGDAKTYKSNRLPKSLRPAKNLKPDLVDKKNGNS